MQSNIETRSKRERPRRVFLTMTAGLARRVQNYRDTRDLPSTSAAIRQLAAVELERLVLGQRPDFNVFPM